MGTFIDLSGRRFGRLIVSDRAPNNGRKTVWNFVCDCGAAGSASYDNLAAGKVKSCGCLQAEVRATNGKRSKVHGHTSIDGVASMSPTYASWYAMRRRCLYEKHPKYAEYGGRGITICDRWLHGEGGMTGFECFLSDMGERPVGMSIDRADSDLGYLPSNCRWATDAGQSRNRRSSVMTMDRANAIRSKHGRGEASYSQLAKHYGVSVSTVAGVVQRRTWV